LGSDTRASSPPCRLIILISGSGSNLQAFIDACRDPGYPCRIVAVISNKADVRGLERARDAGIAAHHLDHRAFPDREAFDAQLQQLIDGFEPDLVVLAGFMRILSAGFVRHYSGRLMNIHPSLLPKYPGLHTHQRALEAGDAEHGATVHFVSEDLDGGPAIIQARVPVLDGDTADALAARVLQQEHLIYPRAVRLFAEGRLCCREGRAELDGETLPEHGITFEA
jgi:phosphoribosylglycinamide formyltransferase 1